MKNNNLFKKYINILWICPLAVTAPRRIREPAAERKGGDAGGRATDFVRKSMNIV